MNLLKKLFAPFLVIALLAFKFAKYALVVFKFTKFGTLLSMLVSVGAYALLFGWPFAVGFVLLIFVHELGHGLVMRKEGIQAGLPVFIPFVGAYIAMRSLPRNAWVEAKVAFGGPALGTLGALAVLGVALYTQEPLFFALAKTGFLLNLFNMVPVSPMDGGRILSGVSKWFLIIGLVIGGVLNIFYLQSALLFVMILLGAIQVWEKFKNPVPGYYAITMPQRAGTGLAYVSLLGLLFWFMDYTAPFLEQTHASHDIAMYAGALLFSLSQLFEDIKTAGERSLRR
jgi:Zn-dependent protease